MKGIIKEYNYKMESKVFSIKFLSIYNLKKKFKGLNIVALLYPVDSKRNIYIIKFRNRYYRNSFSCKCYIKQKRELCVKDI